MHGVGGNDRTMAGPRQSRNVRLARLDSAAACPRPARRFRRGHSLTAQWRGREAAASERVSGLVPPERSAPPTPRVAALPVEGVRRSSRSAPQPEADMAIDLESSYMMTIGGRAVAGAATLDAVNPATGARWADAPDASREQVDEAVAAARAAFAGWSRTSLPDRKVALLRMADRMESLSAGLARLLVHEQGKPLAQATREVLGAVAYLREVCRIDVPWERIVEETPQLTVRGRRLPLGVVAPLVPWNFPVLLAFWKIGPALLAGNTLVLKPSPFTPLTTLKIGEAFRDLLPAGVLNVVSGGDVVGPWLSAHPGVDKLAFTGSTATGKRVMSSASESLKRLTLELG